MKFFLSLLLFSLTLSSSQRLYASEKHTGDESHTACLQQTLRQVSGDTTVAEIRHQCASIAEDDTSPTPDDEPDILYTRRAMESLTRANRFLLAPHNRNFLLPGVYTHIPNTAPFDDYTDSDTSLQNIEVEFQLSVKVLLAQDLFRNKANLFIAYTHHSFWQAYNGANSRPFRETNHEPELMVSVNNDWKILGFTNVLNQLSLSHQSNGQSGPLSRSWNRIKFNAIFVRGRLALAITPWYRLPEEEEDDDNPDIRNYYGNYELTGAYTRSNNIFSFMLRRPLDSRSTVELGWSFPVSSSVRGYLKYFNGYGASMIDYNAKTESVGLGVIFTDLF